MNATTIKARTVAGHKVALTTGRRYLASRPMAKKGMTTFDVFITDTTDGVRMPGEGRSLVIESLSYEQANRFLRAFNNGRMSFDGRVW